jgi:hypothetical protein
MWVFGVNATPFPLARRPELPGGLLRLAIDHFLPRGTGRGLVEYGSAFFDYLMIALGHAYQLGVFDDDQAVAPVTIGLLCDGWPNGGTYRADDVRPLLAVARDHGVRFKVVGFRVSAAASCSIRPRSSDRNRIPAGPDRAAIKA